MLKRIINYMRSVRDDIARSRADLALIANAVGVHYGDFRVDEETPRLECLSAGEVPVLAPGAYPWMGTVYDARPVIVGGRETAYFCGQPSYNTRASMVIGFAEWSDGRYVPDDRPCIYPTVEKYGISIPAFCTHQNEVVGIYFDNYGKGRISDARTRDLYVCTSHDGRRFEKRRFAAPLKGYPYPRLELPWIESVDDTLWLTVRAKDGGRNIVSRARFDHLTGACDSWQHGELPRISVNVASLTAGDHIHIFHGQTVAGGIYVTTFDRTAFEPAADRMMVDPNRNPWAWDMHKICPSPLATGDELILLYTSPTGIGRATFALAALEPSIASMARGEAQPRVGHFQVDRHAETASHR